MLKFDCSSGILHSTPNQFEYIELKQNLEADLIEAKFITAENAADTLVVADSLSCALLREAAMKVVVENIAKIRETRGWMLLEESNALLMEVLEQSKEDKTVDGGDKPDTCVAGLRKRLADRGLDTDGTKQMLVKRLKTDSD